MPGGGNNQLAALNQPTVTQGNYRNAPTTQTFQPFLPGQEEALAQQLTAGFGSSFGAGLGATPDSGQSGSVAEFLANLYQPMDVQKFKEPIGVTAKRFQKDKNLPISTGNEILDQILMGGLATDAQINTPIAGAPPIATPAAPKPSVKPKFSWTEWHDEHGN